MGKNSKLINPKVSVIIAVYNGEEYISLAIESLLNQSFPELEIIIINDGSTDKTKDIISSYTDPRIVLLNTNNKGAGAARNYGISHSNTEYIAILDSDDIALKDRILLQYNFLRSNKDYVAVGSNVNLIDSKGDHICKLELPTTNQEIINSLPGMPFSHPAIMFRKKEFLLVGGYPEFMLVAQDRVLINKLLKKGKGYNLNKTLTEYRILISSNSIRNRADKNKLEEIIKDAIDNDTISEKSKKELNQIYFRSKSESTRNIYDYYVFLAKKYLWNSFNKKRARENIRMANREYKITIVIIVLFILTLIPNSIIKMLYNTLRKDRNGFSK